MLSGADADAASTNIPIQEEDLYFSYEAWDVIYDPSDKAPAPQTFEPPVQIRIASYNVENFTDGYEDPPEFTPERTSNHVAAAAKIIDEVDADIIIFQEMENKYALRMLNKALKKPYPDGHITYFRHRWGDLDTLNIAVLSRIKLKNVRSIRFTRANGPARPIRGILSFEAELGPDRRLLAYGVHLKSNFGDSTDNQRQRKRALEILMSDIAAVSSNAPNCEYEVIVMGDTNVDPDREQFKDDESLDPLKPLVDLWQGRPLRERTTIPTRYGDPEMKFPAAAFDRIFVSENLLEAPWVTGPAQVLQKGSYTKSSAVLPGEKGHVSDHYPVFVDLIPDAAEGAQKAGE